MSELMTTTNPAVTFRRLPRKTPAPPATGRIVRTGPLTPELAKLITTSRPLVPRRGLAYTPPQKS